MPLPPAYSAATARAAGISRGRLRGSRYQRLAHDLVVELATVLPEDAAFSHATAAAMLGAHVDAPRRAHVALTPRRVLPQRAELVVHGRRLTPADVVLHRDLRLTSGAQTFLDLAEAFPPWELVAVGDALFRAGYLDPSALESRLLRADRVRGVVRARRCAPCSRRWLIASDLPDPQPQVPVHDRSGRVVAHGDVGYAEWRVLLEYEGRQHAEADQFDRDVDRYSLMAADGWLVLRFARRRIDGPTAVVGRTRTALITAEGGAVSGRGSPSGRRGPAAPCPGWRWRP
jgi:hypothetical protein